jgi:hypothetical protein
VQCPSIVKVLIGHIEIDEQTEAEGDDDDDYASQYDHFPREDDEITALRTALQECWTLCNTLANLSSIHRSRVFHSSGTPDAHEKAWKTCWKLCQRLDDYRDDESDSLNVRMSLDLCRDFCQALFDVRQRKDEAADSVLRVSFELNNQYVKLPVLFGTCPPRSQSLAVFTVLRTAEAFLRRFGRELWIFTSLYVTV